MSHFLSDMLLGQLPKTAGKGRVISFSQTEIDIRLATGSMRERVLAYLKQVEVPVTSKEVSEGIEGSSPRTHRTLKQLVAENEVELIKVDGSVAEYALHKQALKAAKN